MSSYAFDRQQCFFPSGIMQRSPHSSTISRTSLASLGGTISFILASLLSGDRGTELVSLSLPAPTQMLCCPPGLAPASALCTSGSQQSPDSAQTQTTVEGSQSAELHKASAFPTDAKEREKNRRKAEKEQGIERVVQKRMEIMEDHYDDCGDDDSSLTGITR